MSASLLGTLSCHVILRHLRHIWSFCFCVEYVFQDSLLYKRVLTMQVTKIYNLATKFFPSFASWLLNEKVNFKPTCKCAVPENFHTHPTEGIVISRGVVGFVRPKYLKKCMKLNWNFQSGGRVLEKKKPFHGGKVDIFWDYTIVLFITVLLIWEVEIHLIRGISWLLEQSHM